MRHDLDPKYIHYICIYSFLSINKCNNQLKICIEGSRNTRPKKTFKNNQDFTQVCIEIVR